MANTPLVEYRLDDGDQECGKRVIVNAMRAYRLMLGRATMEYENGAAAAALAITSALLAKFDEMTTLWNLCQHADGELGGSEAVML